MGLFQRMLARLSKPETPEERRVYWRRRTGAGVNITADNALETATVWACVTYLGRTVAQLPWRVLLERAGGGADQQTNHPVSKLLNSRPNSEMGGFSFRETMVGWAALQGNAVAEIQTNASGIAAALWPIHPSRMNIKRDTAGDLVYEVSNEGAPPTKLRGDQVFHLRGYGDGAVGLSVVAYAADSIGWARATEMFGSTYFGDGMQPTGVLKSANKMTPEGMKALRKEVDTIYAGPNGNKTLIIDAGMDWQTISATPENAQFIETRQHQVEEICRWFGVPPHKVMHLLRATFSNIEHQSIEVVVDCITPWARRLEDEADFKLFGANRPGFFTKLDLKGLLRGDFASRMAGYQIGAQLGVYSPNDIRSLEDMNPIGAQGDKRMVPLNMTTLEKLGEEPAKPASAALPAPVEDDEPKPANLRVVRE